MADDSDIKYPNWYRQLLGQGLPANVARSIVNNPSYKEGQQTGYDWPYAYRGREQEMQSHQPELPPLIPDRPKIRGSFKKGGKVKKTGAYKLHKGEKVIPAKKTKQTQEARDKALLQKTRYRR